jgi:hypothetical protein
VMLSSPPNPFFFMQSLLLDRASLHHFGLNHVGNY